MTKTLVRASGNIEKLQTSYVNTLNVYDILKAGKMILTKDAAQGRRGGLRMMKIPMTSSCAPF